MAAGRRDIPLDSFTCQELAKLINRLDEEREVFSNNSPERTNPSATARGKTTRATTIQTTTIQTTTKPVTASSWSTTWAALDPDTITARFNRLVDRAGVPRVRPHDVRHTYATLALDMGVDMSVDPNTLSDRIGHANMAVTPQIYTHRSHGRDQGMAQRLGELIQFATGSGQAKQRVWSRIWSRVAICGMTTA